MKPAPVAKPAKKKPARKKRKRQNLGPKKPLTAFMYFAKANRAKVKEANPEADFGTLGRLVGEAWRKLNDEQKIPYQEQSKADKERYAHEIETVDPALLNKATRKKVKANFGQPKRPLSSYMFFSRDHRAIVQKENPEAKFAQVGKILGAKWKSMSPEDKKPYIEMNAVDKIRYEREMKAYKEKYPERMKKKPVVRKKKAPLKKAPPPPPTYQNEQTYQNDGESSSSDSGSSVISSSSGSESDDEEEEC